MKKTQRSIILWSSVAAMAWIFSGCTPVLPQPQQPAKKQNQTKPVMWQDSGVQTDNYKIRPEPYSLKSKQKDPELLGPQTTLKAPIDEAARQHAEEQAIQNHTNPERFLPRDTTPAKPTQTAKGGMTRSRCISLIGEAKFEAYTKQYGSEAAALRRCVIIEKLQSN